MPLTNLVNRTYFFKLYAYRGMFQRRFGGDLDGQCVGLDFGNLVRLASIDRTMRYVLLPITLDVELFIRVRLVREATEREGEDGHSVVSDYLTSLGHDDRRRRMGEINGFLRDAYSGDLVQKCALPGTMPLWVYLEMAFLGAFIDPWLFCVFFTTTKFRISRLISFGFHRFAKVPHPFFANCPIFPSSRLPRTFCSARRTQPADHDA